MYLIGLILFFILFVFFISIIHNKKIIEKYERIERYHKRLSYYPEEYCFMIVAIILWPLTITIIFIVSIGYCLFKIFSKLIDYFVK